MCTKEDTWGRRTGHRQSSRRGSCCLWSTGRSGRSLPRLAPPGKSGRWISRMCCRKPRLRILKGQISKSKNHFIFLWLDKWLWDLEDYKNECKEVYHWLFWRPLFLDLGSKKNLDFDDPGSNWLCFILPNSSNFSNIFWSVFRESPNS